MGPIEADFDAILPRFDLLGPYRQILIAFFPLFTDRVITADFDGIWPRLTYEAMINRF